MAPPEFADFEYQPSYYASAIAVANSVNTIITTPPQFNAQALNVARGATTSQYITYLAPTATAYNIPVEAGKKYIVSAYLRNRSAVSTNAYFGLKWDNATVSNLAPVTPTVSSATWVRYSFVATAPAGVV